MDPRVGRQSADVAAPVVDPEQESARQAGQRGLRLNRGVQLTDQPADIRRLAPTRPDSGEATMLRTRSCVSDGSRPAAASASATSAVASVSRMPRIWMLPREVSSIAGDAQSLRRVCQGFELRRGDHPARKPHPSQRAVRGVMYLQRAGAGVLVAGPGHQFTVRPSCWPAPSRLTRFVDGAAACAHA